MKLGGSVVVVTGGAKRLGKDMLLALAEAGSSVVIHYHQSREAAQELVATLGERAIAVESDLTTTAGIEELARQTIGHYGRWDGLVNSASIFERISIEEADYQQWEREYALHARAPFFLSKMLYQHRKEKNYLNSGWVVNITDTTLRNPLASRPIYYTSKGALEEQTKVLATTLAPYVRVNAIAPGALLAASEGDLEYFERLKERLPLKELAKREAFVETLLFLATNSSITGETIVVDAGEHLL